MQSALCSLGFATLCLALQLLALLGLAAALSLALRRPCKRHWGSLPKRQKLLELVGGKVRGASVFAPLEWLQSLVKRFRRAQGQLESRRPQAVALSRLTESLACRQGPSAVHSIENLLPVPLAGPLGSPRSGKRLLLHVCCTACVRALQSQSCSH